MRYSPRRAAAAQKKYESTTQFRCLCTIRVKYAGLNAAVVACAQIQ